MKEIPNDPRAQHLAHLHDIAQEDADGLFSGDPKYGYSWKKRGGVGAFMMLARKWDRLEHALAPQEDNVTWSNMSKWIPGSIPAHDIFAGLEQDERSEGLIDDIRDLRRYLLLIEAEARARGIVHGKHRDNKNGLKS